ncbi:MAG: hypothetical protein K2X27_19600 [Candidatus Obscuribacterales bacterium]|nr:hypothetical protein [Candidatus Obscuribacterales bacterium]
MRNIRLEVFGSFNKLECSRVLMLVVMLLLLTLNRLVAASEPEKKKPGKSRVDFASFDIPGKNVNESSDLRDLFEQNLRESLSEMRAQVYRIKKENERLRLELKRVQLKEKALTRQTALAAEARDAAVLQLSKYKDLELAGQTAQGGKLLPEADKKQSSEKPSESNPASKNAGIGNIPMADPKPALIDSKDESSAKPESADCKYIFLKRDPEEKEFALSYLEQVRLKLRETLRQENTDAFYRMTGVFSFEIAEDGAPQLQDFQSYDSDSKFEQRVRYILAKSGPFRPFSESNTSNRIEIELCPSHHSSNFPAIRALMLK